MKASIVKLSLLNPKSDIDRLPPEPLNNPELVPLTGVVVVITGVVETAETVLEKVLESVKTVLLLAPSNSRRRLTLDHKGSELALVRPPKNAVSRNVKAVLTLQHPRRLLHLYRQSQRKTL